MKWWWLKKDWPGDGEEHGMWFPDGWYMLGHSWGHQAWNVSDRESLITDSVCEGWLHIWRVLIDRIHFFLYVAVLLNWPSGCLVKMGALIIAWFFYLNAFDHPFSVWRIIWKLSTTDLIYWACLRLVVRSCFAASFSLHMCLYFTTGETRSFKACVVCFDWESLLLLPEPGGQGGYL